MPRLQVTSGFDDLDRALKRLPVEWAGRLQAVVVKNHVTHKREIARSSNATPEGKRNIAHAIKVLPATRIVPKSVREVTGDTVSYWRGHVTDPREGVAARIEKSIGDRTLKPKRRAFLLIPQGDFVTRTGRPRRKNKEPIDIAKLTPRPFVVRTRSGKRVLVQRLPKGKVGAAERAGARQRGDKLGRASGLGERERVVGVLVRQAKGFRGLDFFGSWDRKADERTDRFRRFLGDVMPASAKLRKDKAS